MDVCFYFSRFVLKPLLNILNIIPEHRYCCYYYPHLTDVECEVTGPPFLPQINAATGLGTPKPSIAIVVPPTLYSILTSACPFWS